MRFRVTLPQIRRTLIGLRRGGCAHLEGAYVLHAQSVYHKPNSALAMITTAFLLKVIIYGLIAAVIIPAIDFMLFVIRESRRPGFDPQEGNSDAAEWKPTPVVAPTQNAPVTQSTRPDESTRRYMPLTPPERRHRTESAHVQEGDGAHLPRRYSTEEVAPPPRAYIASNGVTVTPNMGAFHAGMMNAAASGAPRLGSAGHPHAEYWSYGSPRYYEHR